MVVSNYKLGQLQVNKVMLGSELVWSDFIVLEPENGVDLVWEIDQSLYIDSELKVTVSAATQCHTDRGDGVWDTDNIDVGTPFDKDIPKNGTGPLRFKIDVGTITKVEFNRTTPKNIKSAAIDGTRIDDCTEMFKDHTGLKSFRAIDMVHTGEYTRMFMGCTSLYDVGPFSSSNTDSMESMFENCTSLKIYPNLPVSAKVTIAKYVKNTGIVHAPDIDFRTSGNYSEFFADCTDLETVGRISDIGSNPYTSFFSGCSSLTCIRGISTVTASPDMFLGCTSLTSPDSAKQIALAQGGGSHLDDSCKGDIVYLDPVPGNMFTLYLNPAAHIYLDVRFDIDANAVLSKDMGNGVFVDSNESPGTVIANGTMNGNGPIRIKLSAGNVTNVKFNQTYGNNVLQMAVDATRIASFDEIMKSQVFLKSFKAINVSHITSCLSAFDNTAILENFDMDTSHVVNFKYFLGRSGLNDISSIDLSSAVNLNAAFYLMTNLTSVGDVYAPNATDVSAMLQDCVNLTTIGIVTTADAAKHSNAYRFNYKLTCIKGMDTTTATASSTMFTDDALLTSPDAANQALIEAGAVWLTPGCDNVHFRYSRNAPTYYVKVTNALNNNIGLYWNGVNLINVEGIDVGDTVVVGPDTYEMGPFVENGGAPSFHNYYSIRKLP